MKKHKNIAVLAVAGCIGFAPVAQAAWWDDVGNWFEDSGSAVSSWFEDAAGDVGAWLEQSFDSIEDAFEDVGEFFEDVYADVEDGIVDTYNDVENQVSEWFVVESPNSASSATLMTVQSYDLNTTDAAVLNDFQTRQQAYIDSNAGDLVVDAYTGAAVDTVALADKLEDMLDSKNSDFAMLEFIRILYTSDAYDDQIMASVDQLPKWIHEEGGEDKMYNSENHLLMWMSAKWLLNQRAGVATSDYDRARLEHWLDLKIDYGYYEFMSLVYAPYTLGGLLNLYDFAEDTVIKEKARKAALILLSDVVMSTTEQGKMYGVSGRDYSGKYENEDQPSQTIGRVISLLTGATDTYYESGAGPVDLLALTSLDVSPATRLFGETINVTYRIGHNDSKSFVDDLHSGLNTTDKALFQMSAGSYAHPDYLADMLAMMAENNLDGNDEAIGLLSAFIGGPLEPIIGGGISMGGSFSYSSLLMDKTVDIYKDGSAMLSSVDNYHGGRAGWQQNVWSATTGGSVVYTRSGKNRGGWEVAGQKMLNSHLPYVTQTDNVALIIYKAKPELRLVNSLLPNLIEFELDVNVHWQADAFDETTENGNWIFGREDDNYVALFRHCLNTKTITEDDEAIDIMSCSSNQQVWASVVGTADSHDSFYNFVSVVSAAQIRSEWNWNFTAFKHVWQTTISVDGVQISRNIDSNVDDLFEGDTWELGSIVNTNGLSVDASTLTKAVAGGHTISAVDEQWHNAGLNSCASAVHLHSLSSFEGSDPTMVRTLDVADEVPVSFTQWQSNEPNNSGGEDCVQMRSDNGNWNDSHCSNSYKFACRDDASNWALTSESGKWTKGEAACASLSGSYVFRAPVNAADHAALSAAAAGNSVWLNVNDIVSENTWVADRGGSCQVMSQEEESQDTEVAHAAEDIDFISFIDTEFQGGEAAKVSVDHNWQLVELSFNYEHPVVFASINTFDGSDPVITEVRNITPTSFEVRVAEFEYKDGEHLYETVSYVVMNAGEYDLGDGRYIEVGTAALSTVFDGSPNFQTVNIGLKNYQLITQVQGNNAGRIVAARIDNKAASRFDASLMVQESSRANAGTIEGVLGYMALGQRDYQLTSVKFALKGTTDQYLVAENNGGGDANMNRSSIGSWETLNMISANDVPGCIRDGDNVSILSGGGYYMRGLDGSPGTVDFKRSVSDGISSWETWVLNNHTDPSGCLESGDQIYLTVAEHDLRLQAHSSGDARMIENWGAHEKHKIIFLD